jgi:DNA-binding transcriptional MerR regulator
MKQFPKKLFYKIGEVCDITQVAPHVIRYWETEFSSLKPSKNAAGQRIYRFKDVDLILEIKKLLYDEGYTIAGANKKIQTEVVRKKEEKIPAAAAAKSAKPEVLSAGDFASRSIAELRPVLDQLKGKSEDEVAGLRAELKSILTLLDKK